MQTHASNRTDERGHGHGHHHDHGVHTYSEAERAALEAVAGFNRELAEAADRGADVRGVLAALDPDPLRYMWVDEGGGQIPEFIAAGRRLLEDAPAIPDHQRVHGRRCDHSHSAARPTVAARADGTILTAWVEWEENVGERVVAAVRYPRAATLHHPKPIARERAAVLTDRPTDCFRPTAVFDLQGCPWVFYARAEAGAIAVYARRAYHDVWGPEEKLSGEGSPAFNQEVAVHPDGTVECCWQQRLGNRFAIVSRGWLIGRGWSEPRIVSRDVGAAGAPAVEVVGGDNVWDCAVAPLPRGGSVYAWSAYHEGSYRVVVRFAERGRLGKPRAVSQGSDYALHPHLAVTTAGHVWCTFDVVTVQGHGASGPTRLRPTERLDEDPHPRVVRDSGLYIPQELAPDVRASIRVVRVDPDGLREGGRELAPGLDVNPAGMPRLAATGDGGLVLTYRILRRLPLMHYFWEVAAQRLGPEGWSGPITFAESDAGVEEPAIATAGDGAVVAWMTDGRRERSMTWTEGFGGQECPELAEHYGDIVWHGIHRTGEVRVATLEGPGRAGVSGAPAERIVHSDARRESRSWPTGAQERYRTTDGTSEKSLYWGDLHRHSLVSRCTAGDEPSLEDYYRYSWDVCEYDFWAVTDHAENSTAYQWWSTKKIADLFRVDGKFVPLYGFEWTSLSGHQNVIYGDVERDAPIFSSLAEGSETPAQLWEHLRRYPNFPAVTIPHHPGSAMVPYDWNYGDDEYLRLVEVFQACRGNYESDGCFRQYSDATLNGTFVVDGLRRGYRFGLIASSDHGNGASFVGAYSERLDRAAIFEALRSRRTIAATTRDLVLDVRIRDASGAETFMGGELVTSGPVEIDCYVRGYTDLARVDVVRNGALAHSLLPALDVPAGWITVPLRVEWGTSGPTADWTGGLSVEGGQVVQTPYWSREIEKVTDNGVRWNACTQSFGDVYGAQRGGVELTLVGPPQARVRVSTVSGEVIGELATLRERTVDGEVWCDGWLRLQPGTGGLSSLGGHEQRLTWIDDERGPAWYYVRAFQIDGEMVWSSPIWVDRDAEGGSPG